jgi:hypothetical protein
MAPNRAVQTTLKRPALFPVSRRHIVISRPETETQPNVKLALLAFVSMLIMVSSMLAFVKFG